MSQTVTISAIIIASIFISLVVGQTCPAGVNLVTNPSFENPSVPPGTAAAVPLNGIPGWTGVLLDPACPSQTLDLLNNYNGYTASNGAQWVELDAVCNTAIIQDIQTTPGQLYVLTYDYSPRPGVDAASNVANVYYNGERINSIATSGVGLTNTNWTTYSQLVTGAGPDELVFEGFGTSDGQGAFIDNVHLCPLVCPPPPPCQSLTMDPMLGCVYVPAPDGTPCSASCSGYVCRAGNCIPPPVPCDQPEDHKYYPGYHYEHKEYKYKQYYGNQEHYGYGYGYQYKSEGYGDNDDYKYKPEYKPKDYGYKSEEEEYKPKEYKPKDYKPKDEYEDKDDYDIKDYEYKPKEYKSEEEAYKPKDYEYKPKDYGYKSEEEEYKPKDYGYKSEEEEYKPKEYKYKNYEDSEEEEYNPKESKGHGYDKDEDYEPDFDLDEYFKTDDYDYEYSSGLGGRRSHH